MTGNICTCHSIIKSPLEVNDVGRNIDIFYTTARKGIPLYLTSMPMTCLTGPATLYGIGILSFAEFLFGMCLAQIIYPGITVVDGSFPAATDPRKQYAPALGSIYHNLVNYTVSLIGAEKDIPTIQSGCTVSTESHIPKEDNGTDSETERGYKLWNGWQGWHQVRHTIGFTNQLIAFNMNKMRRDCNTLQRVLENDEVFEEEVEEITYDSDAFDVIQDCCETGNFKDHQHTLQHIGVLR